ncbi:MAG: hypothetical protein WCJ35_24265 [Planctomycetota bacterium]
MAKDQRLQFFAPELVRQKLIRYAAANKMQRSKAYLLAVSVGAELLAVKGTVELLTKGTKENGS